MPSPPRRSTACAHSAAGRCSGTATTSCSTSPRILRSRFQPTVELELEGHTLVGFHGSPRSYDDVLLPESDGDLEPWLMDADVLAGGHTHKQWTRQIGRALFFNPGSVGLAYDHHQPEDDFRFDAVAEYALLSVGGSGPAVEFRRVPHSLGELREVVLGSGRPQAAEHAAMYEPR